MTHIFILGSENIDPSNDNQLVQLLVTQFDNESATNAVDITTPSTYAETNNNSTGDEDEHTEEDLSGLTVLTTGQTPIFICITINLEKWHANI
jgi:hypothetical protein